MTRVRTGADNAVERKSLGPANGEGTCGVKAGDRGEVEAIIARFRSVDHDGDWTLPGAFEDGAPVVIGGYGHQSWAGALPVGRGVLRATSTDARIVGQFWLDTEAGREHFRIAKHLGALGEWSYSYRPLELGELTPELRSLGVRRVLKRVAVDEVSLVLRGAGVGTQTVSVKCTDCAARERVDQIASARRELARFHRLSLELEHDRFLAVDSKAPRAVTADPRYRSEALTHARWGASVLGATRPIKMFFFAPTKSGRPVGQFRPPDEIWIQTGLSATDLQEVVAHEVAHAARHARGLRNAESDARDDAEFAVNSWRERHRWTRPRSEIDDLLSILGIEARKT